MPGLPTGTVTFLFADIEGSTNLVQALGDRSFAALLADHRRLFRAAIKRHGGQEIDAHGDEFFVAFQHTKDGVLAAVAVQQAIASHPWPAGIPVRVRIGLHTGEPYRTGNAYVGLGVHRVARICAAGHGSQILLSQTTAALVKDDLPAAVTLRDLGEHRLKDLQSPERVYQLLHPELPAAFPPLKSLEVLPNNLPVQLTSFIGREREMVEVKRLLDATHLLTLTGMGGSGKTRLALQLAADLLEGFADGVWLVELAALSDPTLVPQTAAAALGVREEPGRAPLVTMLDFLRPKEMLLILDNCEHLTAACAELVTALLRAGPRLKVLATSRERLGITGEASYTVPPLAVPDIRRAASAEKAIRFEAVRLFVERAALSQPGFSLTDENAPAVTQICRALDGIPLAIELAAARVNVLSVAQIAQRLDDRFQLLRGGSRTALPRQQTLQATMDWSYDLLPPKERVLFQRLSVFAGGFALEAAEAICTGEDVDSGEALDLLTHLIDKSLVVVDQQGKAVRYRLLDTVKAYAHARLMESGEERGLQSRFRQWYLHLAERVEPMLSGSDERWLDRLEAEHDNLRVALEGFLKNGEGEAALRLSAALFRFWHVRGYWTEGRRWLETALADSPGAPVGLRAKALSRAGSLAQSQGDYGRAHTLSEQSLAIQRELGDKHGILVSLNTLGNIAYHQGDYAAAREIHEESLAYGRDVGDKVGVATSLLNLAVVADHQGAYREAASLCSESLSIFRELGDKRGAAAALNLLGIIASDQGDYATAHQYYEESVVLHRELGDKRGIAASLSNLGLLARVQSDYATAYALYEESLAIRRELQHRPGIAASLSSLGFVAWHQGSPDRASHFFRESLVMRRRLGDKAGIAECLEGLARVVRDSDRAAQLFGAAEALREAVGVLLPPSDRADYDHQVSKVRSALGEAAFAGAWEKGRRLTLDEAIGSALNAAAV